MRLPKIVATATGVRVGAEYIYPGALCDCGRVAVVVSMVRYCSPYGVRASYTVMPLCQECSEEYMIQEWSKETAFLSLDSLGLVAEAMPLVDERRVCSRSCFNTRQDEIMQFIESQSKPVETRDIVGRFGGSVDTVRVVLNRWVKRGHLELVQMQRQGTKVRVAGYRVK